MDLITKMNILAQAVVVPQPPEITANTEHVFYNEDAKYLDETSEPKRILINDIYKVLVLNN